MKRFLLLLMLLLVTSCFLMPPGAPHTHSYKSVEGGFKVDVLCTPRSKTYHFFYTETAVINGCSKTFIDQACSTFKRDDFFEDTKFQKTIKINDRKFHQLLEADTLILSFSDSKVKKHLLPYK